MTKELFILALSLIVIVGASELFTNAIETLGARLKFSEGVTGSIFAAVGTALPETMVPLVAILTGHEQSIGEEVGVGAILGAPFMLSTLAMLFIGITAWRYRKKRKTSKIRPEEGGLRRDMEFFLFAFGLSFLVAFTPQAYRTLRLFVAFILILSYGYYLLLTIKASSNLVEDGHATEEPKALYISKIFQDNLFFAVVQMSFALFLIIIGAKGFVVGVEHLAGPLHIPVIALSLLIVPIATELPEKVNSILWTRRGKDTLAVGNVTGAMVFQGSLLPAIGIFLTPWHVNVTVMTSAIITLTAALWIYFLVRKRAGGLRPIHLLVNGGLYLTFVLVILHSSGII